MPTLVALIKKLKPILTEAQIEKSLRAFYNAYPFDSKEYKQNPFD
jgi:hypothetical protein